mmetsp:Transcript_6710/g.16760  ORF Transcript_6710/g.16760 Transcript_6710/m.16760 type:complete len:101 (+) Transcript_6710:941-1243(+)
MGAGTIRIRLAMWETNREDGTQTQTLTQTITDTHRTKGESSVGVEYLGARENRQKRHVSERTDCKTAITICLARRRAFRNSCGRLQEKGGTNRIEREDRT